MTNESEFKLRCCANSETEYSDNVSDLIVRCCDNWYFRCVSVRSLNYL